MMSVIERWSFASGCSPCLTMQPFISEIFASEGAELGFRRLAEQLPQLIWTCRPDGWCDYLSPQWVAYTGGRESAYQGYEWSSVVHPDDRQRLVDSWLTAVATKQPYDVEYRLRRHDGKYRWFRAQAVPVEDGSNQIKKWLGTSTDIDELKHIENSLRESDQRKNEFLATLSHELRNPLAPIRTAVHLLREYCQGNALAMPVLQMLDRQVNHLIRLIEDLLDISRISSGSLMLRKEWVEVAVIARDAMHATDSLMKERGHQLHVALPEQGVWLECDPVRVAQIITNLLSNAAQYTDNGGRIFLEARKVNDIVLFTVRDNGIGIPAELIETMFEMFKRGQSLNGNEQYGLGIGLPLSRRLAEMHNGTISARSKGPGHGTEFTLSLPIGNNDNRKTDLS